MRDILPQIDRWRTQNERIAIATVVKTWGSSPRGLGSKMAVTANGEICGSVSGGCVEAAVIETALEVIKTGRSQLLCFGVSNDEAWDVGLACGGSIEVFVAPFQPNSSSIIRAALDEGHALAVVTIIRGADDLLGRELIVGEDGQITSSLRSDLDQLTIAAARQSLRAEQPGCFTLPSDYAVEVFIDVIAPALEIIVVGGVHIAIALTQLAKVMGYRTTVIDPRGLFGTDARFPHVDHLIHAWPDQALTQIGLSSRSAIVTLSHDPKFDDPALRVALPSPAFYVGALGSRKTQEQRRQRLLAAGISEANLARLRGPIGIDLGGRTPEEIALATLAEIVTVYHSSAKDRGV